MATRVLQQVRDAVSHLDPSQVRRDAEREITIGLTASSSSVYTRMEEFLAPPPAPRSGAKQIGQILWRKGTPGAPVPYTLEFVEAGLPKPPHAFSFDPDKPEALVKDVLDQRSELSLPLARHILAFRDPVVRRTMLDVSRENTLFAIATAVPSIVPLLSLPLGVGEFASDTAFITMNQIRMAFLIAAAYGEPIGYREQRAQVASMIAGAFGWRAIARELVGQIPFGGGIIPKAAISFAGTYVVGLSLDRWYKFGCEFTKDEKRQAYLAALERGKEIARTIMESVKQRRAV